MSVQKFEIVSGVDRCGKPFIGVAVMVRQTTVTVVPIRMSFAYIETYYFSSMSVMDISRIKKRERGLTPHEKYTLLKKLLIFLSKSDNKKPWIEALKEREVKALTLPPPKVGLDGKIVLYNFSKGSMGSEMRKTRYGVVLHETKNWVLAVPATSRIDARSYHQRIKPSDCVETSNVLLDGMVFFEQIRELPKKHIQVVCGEIKHPEQIRIGLFLSVVGKSVLPDYIWEEWINALQ